MNSAFVLHFGEHAFALHKEAHLAVSAKLGRVGVKLLDFPALPRRIHAVHSEQRICEQCGFLAACACAYLDYAAPVVVRVLREQEYFQLLGELFHSRFVLVVLALGKLAKLCVAAGFVQCFNRVVKAALSLLVFLPDLHKRGQVLVFSHQVAVQLVIGYHRRVGQLCAYLVIARLRHY